MILYLPTEVAATLGKKIDLEVGIVSALPWTCAPFAAHWIPHWANRMRRSGILVVVTLATSAAASALFLAYRDVLAGFRLLVVAVLIALLGKRRETQPPAAQH